MKNAFDLIKESHKIVGLELRKQKSREYNAVYRLKKENKERMNRWRQENRDRINAVRRIKYKDNIQYKIARRINGATYNVITRAPKRSYMYELLGCNHDALVAHIASLFVDGMTWNNYGKDGWEIDHVVPLNTVDLTNMDDLKKVCHYTNLQPLFVKDNQRKAQHVINIVSPQKS